MGEQAHRRPGAFNGLGEALWRLRMERKLTQADIAEAAGMSKAMISGYERGKRLPAIETLERILEVLKVSLGELERKMEEVRTASRSRSVASEAHTRARVTPVASEQDFQSAMGIDEPLGPNEEQAFRDMVVAFHRLIRSMGRPSLHTGLGRAGEDGESVDGAAEDFDLSDSVSRSQA